MTKILCGRIKPLNQKLKAKNNMYNKYIQNGRFEKDFLLLETLITELNKLINTTKALYYKNLSKS